MKRSEFAAAVADEFGAAYGAVIVDDLVLERLGEVTARNALDAGVPAREVWLALCDAMSVPYSRRHGVGRPAIPDDPL